MQARQIDWVEGGKRKDAGMSLTLEHEHEEWKNEYRMIATDFLIDLARGTLFTAEHLRAVVHKKIGDPHHPNVWGAMFNGSLKQWKKHGIVEFTNQYLDATNSQAHRRAIRLYRRV